MKKRILSILLTILLMFIMVGCNQETDSPSKNHSEKVEDDDDKHKDDKDEKETTTADKTEMTMEEKLLSGYWYFNVSTVSFIRMEFNEDGTYNGLIFAYDDAPYTQERDGEWIWGGTDDSILIRTDKGAPYFEVAYDEAEECFKAVITIDMVPEQQEHFKQYKIIRVEETFEVLDEEAYNDVFGLFYDELDDSNNMVE